MHTHHIHPNHTVCPSGDTLHVHEYNRLSPLVAMPTHFHNIKELQPGDCVVAFSKKSLYLHKKRIGVWFPFD